MISFSGLVCTSCPPASKVVWVNWSKMWIKVNKDCQNGQNFLQLKSFHLKSTKKKQKGKVSQLILNFTQRKGMVSRWPIQLCSPYQWFHLCSHLFSMRSGQEIGQFQTHLFISNLSKFFWSNSFLDINTFTSSHFRFLLGKMEQNSIKSLNRINDSAISAVIHFLGQTGPGFTPIWFSLCPPWFS